jgi:hypothetical protein
MPKRLHLVAFIQAFAFDPGGPDSGKGRNPALAPIRPISLMKDIQILG